MTKNRSFWGSTQGAAASVLIIVAIYFLLMEHRAHIFQALPFLIIFLLCPIMHFFMHGGHGGHGEHEQSAKSEEDAYNKGLEDGRRQSDVAKVNEERR